MDHNTRKPLFLNVLIRLKFECLILTFQISVDMFISLVLPERIFQCKKPLFTGVSHNLKILRIYTKNTLNEMIWHHIYIKQYSINFT